MEWNVDGEGEKTGALMKKKSRNDLYPQD